MTGQSPELDGRHQQVEPGESASAARKGKGLVVVGKGAAGHASQREEVRLVRVLVLSEDACYASGDALSVQHRCAFGLDLRDGSEEGLKSDESCRFMERIGLFVGDRERCDVVETNKLIGPASRDPTRKTPSITRTEVTRPG